MNAHRAIAIAAAAAAIACGGAGVDGRYVPRGDAFFDSLTFKSDGTVDVVMIGVTHQGRYTVEDGAVTIVAPDGTPSRLSIEGGCVIGPELFGTYCRDGSASVGTSGGGDAGDAESYETATAEGRITLEFEGDDKVRVTMTPFEQRDAVDRMSFDASYQTRGRDRVIVLPGGEQLTLTPRAGGYDGTLDGETVRFVRK